MKEILERLNKLSKTRIDYFLSGENYGYYKGSETYFGSILGELDEVKKEIKKNNSVYLEDELGDVLWTYLCFLNSLEKEGYITDTQKVFERSIKKYSGRINEKTGENNGIWEEVKKVQKRELEKENLLKQYPGL